MTNGLYPLILEILRSYRIQVIMEWQGERRARTDLHLHPQRPRCSHRCHRSYRTSVDCAVPVAQQPAKTILLPLPIGVMQNSAQFLFPSWLPLTPVPMRGNIIPTFLKFLLLLLEQSRGQSVP